jgi:hypothetical protein
MAVSSVNGGTIGFIGSSPRMARLMYPAAATNAIGRKFPGTISARQPPQSEMDRERMTVATQQQRRATSAQETEFRCYRGGTTAMNGSGSVPCGDAA